MADVLARPLAAYLRLDPEAANYYGLDEGEAGGRFADRINDYSPAGESARRQALRCLHAEVAGIERTALSPDERIVHDVASSIVAGALDSAQIPYGTLRPFWFTGHTPYVVNALSGPTIDTPAHMIGQAVFRTNADAESYVLKLQAFAAAFGGVEQKIVADARSGVVLPRPLLQRTIATLEAFPTATAEEHGLYRALESRLAALDLSPSLSAGLLREAAAAMTGSVFPAYRRLATVLAGFAPTAPVEGGLSRLPEGHELYRALVRSLGDSTLAPQEIHELGVAEVTRLQAQMLRSLSVLGHTSGTFARRLTAAFDAPAARYPDSELGRAQVLADVRADLARVHSLLPGWFTAASLPRLPLEVRRVPAFADSTVSAAYYDPPSSDGKRPGIYWVNLGNLRDISRARLRTTTFHEGIPGHHLQASLALSRATQPLLQKIANLNGFNEGWAMYAEQLAAEMGMYEDDPHGELGRLADELFRSARLVADTGLHALGWTRQFAVDYLVRESAVPLERARAEIDRYLVWPAQALGYKLGMIRIVELREVAKSTLGSDFDLREFHEILLRDGSVPMAVAAAAVHALIDRRRR